MFTKTTVLLAFAAISSVARAASSPPGCLLGAVNEYKNPADIEAVCKSKDATQKVAKFCEGDELEAALEAFADICNGKGVEVSTAIPSATGSTSSGSPKPTGTGNGGYGNGTATDAPAPTGPGSANPTNGPGGPGATDLPDSDAGKIQLSAAALLAGLGVVVAAL